MEVAQQEYTTYQQQDHPGLTVESGGLFVSPETPWLAASPDGLVHDPHSSPHPNGLVEIKNPRTVKDKTLDLACTSSKFCLEKQEQNGVATYKLKDKHDYYYQVQCQMYCADRQWCDFVVRTNKQLHVERIYRDEN